MCLPLFAKGPGLTEVKELQCCSTHRCGVWQGSEGSRPVSTLQAFPDTGVTEVGHEMVLDFFLTPQQKGM